jgi:hypothetical protein
MENSIDCTKMHGSSKRSILLLVEDWCSMRRDVSRANVGHLRWQRKMTEAPNIPKITAAIRKMSKSTVKNGHLHYFFSQILFLTLLDVSFQWGLLLLVVFCH